MSKKTEFVVQVKADFQGNKIQEWRDFWSFPSVEGALLRSAEMRKVIHNVRVIKRKTEETTVVSYEKVG